jgi:hypothetical protein
MVEELILAGLSDVKIRLTDRRDLIIDPPSMDWIKWCSAPNQMPPIILPLRYFERSEKFANPEVGENPKQ